MNVAIARGLSVILSSLAAVLFITMLDMIFNPVPISLQITFVAFLSGSGAISIYTKLRSGSDPKGSDPKSKPST